MAEKNGLEQVVERIVAEVLQSHVPQLQKELAQRVLQEIGSQPEAAAAPASGADPGGLLKAVSAIHTGTTQREILRALLDSAAHYSGRSALFVVKAGAASGWQGRGFSNTDEVKDFSLDVSSGIAARAMHSRAACSARAGEMDQKFLGHFGNPEEDRVVLLPLLLKERVAALVYADSGNEGGQLDTASLELLVLSASAWLEVTSLRKQAGKEGSPEAAPVERPHTPPPVQAPAFNDPFAAHLPRHAAAVPPPAVEAPMAGSSLADEVAPTSAATAAAVAPDPFAGMSPEDAEVHRKAQRFARLLVDEIKLYNQAKVAEGRKNRDLYSRLKDDIDKSMSTYQKRYGSTVASNADYFNQELVRSLAEDDRSLMGANFQR
jgi:hypothetical protein